MTMNLMKICPQTSPTKTENVKLNRSSYSEIKRTYFHLYDNLSKSLEIIQFQFIYMKTEAIKNTVRWIANTTINHEKWEQHKFYAFILFYHFTFHAE